MRRAAPYIAFVIFVGCAYLGYFGAGRIVYRHKQSTWFNALGKQDAEQLREASRTLLAFSVSSLLIQNTPASLQRNVASLEEIRREAPQELWPILDLRLAKDYAMMARLERSENESAAIGHQQSAKLILGSLGWQDVSDNALTALADGQLHSRLKR